MSVCSKFNVLETYCKTLVQMFVQYFIINLLCRQVIAWHKGFYFKFAFVDGHQMFQGFLFYFKCLVIPCCSHFAQHFLEEAVKLIRHTCIAANKLVWETFNNDDYDGGELFGGTTVYRYNHVSLIYS